MDLATLVFANFALMAFAAVVLGLLARRYPQVAGGRALFLCTLCLAAGAAVVGFADPVRRGWALALANGLLVLGFACLNWAIALYWRQRWPGLGWHLLGAAALAAAYAAFTGPAHNNLGARALLVGTAMGLELGWGAGLLARVGARPQAWALAAFAGFNLLRGPVTWLTADQPQRQHWVLVVTNYGFLVFGAVLALVLAGMVIHDLRTRLDQLAATDELTGLTNRRGLEREAERVRAQAARRAPGSAGAVVVMDLDRFKAINDRHGHAAGDEALRAVARFLRSRLRAEDIAARLGGEEFVVLLPGLDQAAAVQLAERLRLELAALPLGGPRAPGLTASWGVAAGHPGEAWSAWLQRADQALYAAKQAGRNCVRAAGCEPALVGASVADS